MATINFRIDEETKRVADALFADLGMTMSGAITIFLKRAIEYRGIPFEVRLRDPSARPMSELLQRMDDVEHGRNCHYHDLIEVEDKEEIHPRTKPSREKSRRRRAVA
ncbi:MAG: type II toxin-antitoxin system RelB/DinJ family antitoxin [Kiritimatiellae bacterium]|nr:type II toxin-antitoxin system RelB/DinJ family antitoxin [Kiritimatiellia bacterium]